MTMSLNRTRILFVLLLTAAVQTAWCETLISGKVERVVDGNTLEVTTAKEGSYRIVLKGIDCPELGQEYGLAAKQLLEKWLLHRDVVVHLSGKDRQKNYIGIVLLEDNLDVRMALLAHGLAWTSEKDAEPDLETIRIQAAAERKGLWAQNDPTPPWIYRRLQSMSAPKSR